MYLYTFKDVQRAASIDVAYNREAKEKKNFDWASYEKDRSMFGVIVFESDKDLDPKTVYDCYSQRWLIELAFRRYKSCEGLNQTCVQDDYTVIGSEFTNYIATVISCRLANTLEKAGLLDEQSYADVMEDLAVAWRMTDAPTPAVTYDKHWVHPLKKSFEIMIVLGLCQSNEIQKTKNSVGRHKNKSDFVGPKRPRGRPRKTD